MGGEGGGGCDRERQRTFEKIVYAINFYPFPTVMIFLREIS